MDNQSSPLATNQAASLKFAGWILIMASILSLVLMMYHPTLHTRNMGEFIERILASSLINGLVHGGLIALSLAIFFGFSCFCSEWGLNNGWVRSGLISYGFGVLCMSVAAFVSGFLFAELAEYYQGRAAEELQYMAHSVRLGRAVNQVTARAGVAAMSLAIVFWSIPFLRQMPGHRVIGYLGILLGGAPLVLLLVGYLPMNIHGVLSFIMAQTIWTLAVAIFMIRRSSFISQPGRCCSGNHRHLT